MFANVPQQSQFSDISVVRYNKYDLDCVAERMCLRFYCWVNLQIYFSPFIQFSVVRVFLFIPFMSLIFSVYLHWICLVPRHYVIKVVLYNTHWDVLYNPFCEPTLWIYQEFRQIWKLSFSLNFCHWRLRTEMHLNRINNGLGLYVSSLWICKCFSGDYEL